MISTSKITVRYAETDRMGIVHHSVYPIWYEVARTDFCIELGLPYSKMEEIGILTPLVELQSKYKKPANYEDVLEIKTRIQKFTPARIEFYYEVFHQGDSTPINTGCTVHALVDKSLHPINVKKKFPEVYDLLVSACENNK